MPSCNIYLEKNVAASIKKFLHGTAEKGGRLVVQAQLHFFELTASEIISEVGKSQYMLLLNDVTDQQLEEQRIHSILEALPQMAWTTNKKGEATYLTQGWFAYTGQTKEEAMGSGWAAVVHPDDIDVLGTKWLHSVQTGKPFSAAARYKNSGGEYRWHLTRASAIKDAGNEISLWVGTCTDINDQILLTEELERKVKERTRTLEETNSELEQFAHVSSHDLQEPLRKIRTFTELLKANSYECLDPSSKKYLDKITETAARMSQSLTDLLHFTKLHKEEKFVPTDLNELIRLILEDLELMVSQKKASIKTDPLPVIKAIPIQMQQLFYNLINNALKFSKDEVSPHIEIGAKLLNDKEVMLYPALDRFKEYYEIVVRDNGIGFDQKYAEQIFTIFQRLHNKTSFSGTGIGLALVKKVVGNHHGHVYALSEPGQGASFHIILPAE